jgi:hypothetical protein
MSGWRDCHHARRPEPPDLDAALIKGNPFSGKETSYCRSPTPVEETSASCQSEERHEKEGGGSGSGRVSEVAKGEILDLAPWERLDMTRLNAFNTISRTTGSYLHKATVAGDAYVNVQDNNGL